MSEISRAFLEKYGMLPELVDPAVYSDMICEDMKRGLAGENSFMPMIPTYLVNDGAVPKNDPVIVIDAGGTNFRCGLLRFSESEELQDRVRVGRYDRNNGSRDHQRDQDDNDSGFEAHFSLPVSQSWRMGPA